MEGVPPTSSGGKSTSIGGVKIDHDQLKRQSIDHLNNKVMVLDDIDRHMWELMTNVPKVHKNIAFVCAFLNVIIPGLGTLIAACSA